MSAIAKRFDAAAPRYDGAASVQVQVAERLVELAAPDASAEILDVGSGTGFVAAAAQRRWPGVSITALDAAPAMLREAQRKIQGLRVLEGDAARLDPPQRFDAIFSSMALHWLPEPREALKRWQSWLKPGGHLYAALLVEGSFRDWRGLCTASGLKDGLWKMPRADFADELAGRREKQTIAVAYSSAAEFLHRLKFIGAATPRADHVPFRTPEMRRLLVRAPQPFIVSYEVLYIALPSSPNI